MNQQTILMIMAIVLIGVLFIVIVIVPYLKAKGVNTTKILANAERVTEGFDKALVVVQDILPNNPTVAFLTIIQKWAKIGVGNAEQLAISGEATSDERAEIATKTVYSVLNELKIDVDNNKKILIDAAIKEAVLNLGHTKDPIVKTADTPVEVAKIENVAPILKYFAIDGVTELAPVTADTLKGAANVETTYPTENTIGGAAINPIDGQPII